MNWAEEYADTVETRSEQREHRRRQSAQERAKWKALKERDYLYNEWRKWHQEQLKLFLGGPYAEAANELNAFLIDADPDSGDELVEMVKRGPWVDADDDTKYHVLRMIDHAITRMRESNGLEPFDDALDDDLTVFLEIRRFIAGW